MNKPTLFHNILMVLGAILLISGSGASAKAYQSLKLTAALEINDPAGLVLKDSGKMVGTKKIKAVSINHAGKMILFSLFASPAGAAMIVIGFVSRNSKKEGSCCCS
jgi:hypothetical protein